jgi:hypothetical protein
MRVLEKGLLKGILVLKDQKARENTIIHRK